MKYSILPDYYMHPSPICQDFFTKKPHFSIFCKSQIRAPFFPPYAIYSKIVDDFSPGIE